MTEQPDLKARVEELERENAALTKALTGLTRGAINALHDKKAAESRLALADRLAEAGRVAQQTLLEVRHAHISGERWYTRGESGLREQVRNWLDKAEGPLSAALTAYEENTSDTSARNVPAGEGQKQEPGSSRASPSQPVAMRHGSDANAEPSGKED